MPAIKLLDLGQELAEYVMVRSQNGQDRLYIIEFGLDAKHQVNIGAEGIHYITASVTDVQGVVHTDIVAITALNFAQMDTLLQGKWNGMKEALTVGNIEAAMPYFMGDLKRDIRQSSKIYSSPHLKSLQVLRTVTFYRLEMMKPRWRRSEQRMGLFILIPSS